MSEPLYKSFDDAADDVYSYIINNLSDNSYAIFGHSMGAALGYAVIKKIVNNNKKLPVHSFFSARIPPHLKKDTKVHHLSDDLFTKEILSFGGTDEMIFQNKELFDMVIPIIKSDLKMLFESKACFPQSYELDMTILYGKQDELCNRADVKEWQLYTSKKCNFIEFSGGHFFINEQYIEVVNIINNVLRKYLQIQG